MGQEKIQTIRCGNIYDQPAISDFTTSDNDYVDALLWGTRLLQYKFLRAKAETKDLKIQVLGSRDAGNTFPYEALTEITLTAGDDFTDIPIYDYYSALKVQAKPATEDENGTLIMTAEGQSNRDLIKADTELTITGTDLATSAKQDTQKTAIDAVKTAVDAVTTKLIAAPATESAQTTGNNSLSSIDGKLAKGDQLKAASLSVTPSTDIPAGRAIGKVTLDGPSAPTPVAISFASADAQTIIAAPSAGNRIRITKLWLSCSANFIIQMISGSTTIGNLYGMGVDMDFIQPLTLNTAEAFKLDSNIATQTYGGVCYYVEAV